MAQSRGRDVHTGDSPVQVSKPGQQRCVFSLGTGQPSRVRRAATHGRGRPAEGNEDPRWIRKTFMQDVEQCRATAYVG